VTDGTPRVERPCRRDCIGAGVTLPLAHTGERWFGQLRPTGRFPGTVCEVPAPGRAFHTALRGPLSCVLVMPSDSRGRPTALLGPPPGRGRTIGPAQVGGMSHRATGPW